MDKFVKIEAEAILKAFQRDLGMRIVPGDRIYPGPKIDGYKAIEWMQENNYSWRDVEWGGFFVKHLAQSFIDNIPDYPLEKFTRQRKYFLKGHHVWDVRLHNFEQGLPVILTDVKGLEDDLQQFGGMGIVVLFSEPEPDLNYEFLVWHDNLKGNPTDYTIRVREFEGKPPRTRKKGYFVIEGRAFYLTKRDIDQGLIDGWMSDNFQASMRNSNTMPRKPKYILHVDDVPNEFVVAWVNFNIDPEELKNQ